jgi:DNA topoisomerase-1
LKKKETEDQQKNGAAYQICYIDGKPEKVSNYCIEPPGLFRGRGEHPSIGRVKHRVVPEYATINIGYDDPIPPCPISGHSWKGVINNTEATWLCHFKDEKNTYSKSKKYLFLAAESDLKAMNDKKKYERARRLKDIIDDVRALYNKKMSSDSKEN